MVTHFKPEFLRLDYKMGTNSGCAFTRSIHRLILGKVIERESAFVRDMGVSE
jgi:hypothetical protein